jgi:hypothetical protein
MHPATGVPKQKNEDFFLFHDMLGARRRGLGTGRPRTYTIPACACEDSVAVSRAATGGTCCAGRFAAHTLRRQQCFKKKVTKEPLSWRVRFLFTALRSPSLAGVVVVLWLL